MTPGEDRAAYAERTLHAMSRLVADNAKLTDERDEAVEQLAVEREANRRFRDAARASARAAVESNAELRRQIVAVHERAERLQARVHELECPPYPTVDDRRPHSRACGVFAHPHGHLCAADCPTCLTVVDTGSATEG